MMTPALLLKATAILLLALAATRFTRGSRAALRHVLLAAGFAMLLLLPAVSTIAPVVAVTVPAALQNTIDPFDDPLLVDSLAPREAPAARAPAVAPPQPRWNIPPVWDVLTTVWIAGVALFLLPVVVGLWKVRLMRRSGLPWRAGQEMVDRLRVQAGVGRPVQALLHETLPGPMTCGIIRPAIVFPADASAWSVEDLDRAIVHELAHVRRLDWLTQCSARVIAAVYWLHPVVWLAWRQFGLEAERACDDAVLSYSSNTPDGRGDVDETAYADQLVHLAQRLSAGPGEIHLAMANRRDLSARVAAVLDSHRPRGRAGRVAIVAASFLAMLVVAAISPLQLVARSVNTTRDPQQPKLAVVSVKPCLDEPAPPAGTGRQGGVGSLPVSPDRLILPCMTAERMIALAYVTNGEALVNNRPIDALDNRSQWIKGLPGWARSDKFTVEAKTESPVDRKVLLGAVLASLLEDRFKLKLHRDVEDGAMYALTVARGGLKMKPESCVAVTPDTPSPEASYTDAVLKGRTPNCGTFSMVGGSIPGSRRWVIGGQTMKAFSGILSGAVDRQVIDRTALEGEYTVRLEFMPDEHTRGRPATALPGTELPPPGTGPNIFAALETQLGLKLEPAKAPRGFIVIDRIERPVPDEDMTGTGVNIPLAEGPAGQSAPPRKYEVASIKRCTDPEDLRTGRARGSAGGTNASISPGRFSVPCVTLEQLIYLAYASYGAREDERLAHDYLGTASDSTKVRGGPDWAHSSSDKWAIEATAPGVTERTMLMGSLLQRLLEDRFKLKIRRASETVPMYALRVAKGGLKVKPLADDECGKRRDLPESPTNQRCGLMLHSSGTLSRLHYVGFDLGALARVLSESVRLHVVNETGVSGQFVIDLTYAGDETTSRIVSAPPGADLSAEGPSIFTALEEQLGLKLDKITGSKGYIVIEYAERPTPDGPARATGAGVSR
jgi:uncharacterized protein (TIGR03435 family)